MAHEYDPASPTLETDGSNTAKQLSLDKENFMKPEKVKSRWRRNSEMETQESNSEESTSNTIKCISVNKDLCINSKNFPTFDVLEENLYLFERKRTKHKKEVRRMLCECSLKDEDEVGCKDECLNRLLMIECGSRCATGEACSNRRFQKRLYVKNEPFKTEKKGWGLKVLEDVPRGTFIIEYVGEVLNSTLFKQRVKHYAREKEQHYYFMALKTDEVIDAHNKGNASRFVNHSCDPNCETQKWTVNGELRVGFFAKRDIKAQEELTFDYQLERYGQQAQKCYCESENCKGYIGVSDEITVDVDTSKKESKNNKRKKSLEKENLEDLMLEEEIEKLSFGLRNKDETLMLARLMVRAEDSHSREKLLDIILSTTELACLRLFLDYHGLTLLWTWMASLCLTDTTLKKKILKVLSLLPVPNKTMLLDSKVLNVVQMWASINEGNEKVYSIDCFTKAKSCDTSDSETDGSALRTSEQFAFSNSTSDKLNCDVNMTEITNSAENTDVNNATGGPEGDISSPCNKTSDASTRSDEESGDTSLSLDDNVKMNKYYTNKRTASLAQDLLDSWKDLKEVFRIPRREKRDEDRENKKNSFFSHPKEQLLNKEHEVKNQNMQAKQNIIKENTDDKSSFEERAQEIKVVPFQRKYTNSTSSRKIKEERRALFAEKMQHRERRKKTLLHTNYNPPSHSDYPNNENYQFSSGGSKLHHYMPTQNMHNQYLYNASAPRPPLLPTPETPPNIVCATPHQSAEATVFNPNVMFPPPATQNFQMPFLSLPPPTIPPVAPEHSIAVTHCQNNSLASHLINIPSVVTPLVPMQIGASSEPLSTGYVNAQSKFLCEEKPVMYMPQPTFTTSDEPEQAYPVIQENGELHKTTLQSKVIKLPPNWKTATDSEGTTYYYDIITRKTQWDPPGMEENVTFDNSTPTYDEPKERKRETHSRRSHKKHSKRKSTTTAPADTSSNQVNGEIAKKIKELFRTKMSTYVVQCLNPYRKDDCKVGRITSNEDFKHLARKLTHFVMAKELKHCKNVEDLDANDSVRLKAKDFIRKYMDRYGPVYRKEKCVSLED